MRPNAHADGSRDQHLYGNPHEDQYQHLYPYDSRDEYLYADTDKDQYFYLYEYAPADQYQH